MKSKPAFAEATSEALLESDREDRSLALEYIADAWNEAEEDGIEPHSLAHASLFAAITTFVETYGEEAAAELISALPERIRAGDYNITRSLQ